MAINDNFKWLVKDIDNSLILKVIYKNNFNEEVYGYFNVKDVLDTTGDDFEIKTANIDDLTKLLTLGIVRFVNISDSSDIIDVPFRNLYLLYKNANVLGEDKEIKKMSFKELDIFSIIDGTIRNQSLLISSLINNVSDDFNKLMKIAYEYGDYGMQEKFDALSEITLINHRRLVEEKKSRSLK